MLRLRLGPNILSAVNAPPITRPDNSFSSLLSACFACIASLHLRWILALRCCGRMIAEVLMPPATPQMLEARRTVSPKVASGLAEGNGRRRRDRGRWDDAPVGTPRPDERLWYC